MNLVCAEARHMKEKKQNNAAFIKTNKQIIEAVAHYMV